MCGYAAEQAKHISSPNSSGLRKVAFHEIATQGKKLMRNYAKILPFKHIVFTMQLL
jgi:hypothetical protein